MSANARFDEANGYAALQSSDTLMVEVDGEWKKSGTVVISSSAILSMTLLSFVRGNVGFMRLGGLSRLLHS